MNDQENKPDETQDVQSGIQDNDLQPWTFQLNLSNMDVFYDIFKLAPRNLIEKLTNKLECLPDDILVKQSQSVCIHMDSNGNFEIYEEEPQDGTMVGLDGLFSLVKTGFSAKASS